MFNDSDIARCIDLARGLAERTGPKEPKYYEPTFLARIFGYYSKPRYPSQIDISSLEDLWVHFEPRFASNEQKAELLIAWIGLLNFANTFTVPMILEKVDAIRERHKSQYSDGLSTGIRYHFMAPFHLIARELDEQQRPAPITHSAENLKEIISTACEEVKAKWLYFHQNIHLKSDIPLSKKIDMFAMPIQEFFRNKYPLILSGPTEIFWLTIFTAILESKTHSKEDVNAAITELQEKYACS